MDDLISRKDAVSRISDLLIIELKGARIPTWNEVYNAIGDVPSVPAVPAKHGRWIEQEGFDGDIYYTCSSCYCDWTTIDGTPAQNNMRYCPECGARMDLEVQNEG